eukprot:144391_1
MDHQPRNDTLGAKIVDIQYLTNCIQEDSYICVQWQAHQITTSSIMIAFIGFMAIYTTYQFCCSKNPLNNKIKPDIKCISLTYFYCLLIAYLCALIISVFSYQPITSGGWEYSEIGGWLYEENISGWQWEGNDDEWVWNDKGSWQWNPDEGWYFSGQVEYPLQWRIIGLLCFAIAYIGLSCASCFSYLYPFRRLYHSFQGSQFVLSNKSKNIHHFIIVLIFFLSIIGSFFHFTLVQLTSQRIVIAVNIFYALGIAYIMYQFNTRLLELVKMPSSVKMDIQKKNVQLKLIRIVVKYSLLTSIQLITFAIGSITASINQILTPETEQVTTAGQTHIFIFWIGATIHLCIATCIFIGFTFNHKLYNKLCFYCHQRFDMIVRKMSSENIVSNENVQLETVASTTKTKELSSNVDITATSNTSQQS